MLKVFWRI